MADAKVLTQAEVHALYATYMNTEHIQAVDHAYEYAFNLHRAQKRKSGEPYIIHPIQVAGILADLKMDPDTVIAGYLHDVVEDTDAEIEDVAHEFGADVAAIVDGVSKISKIEYKSDSERLAENHRKLLLAMSHDIRVIFVKLADRLHNIRTLSALRPEKQKRIAGETLEIYAPLADRLGIMTIKWELEDTSLRYLDYEAYHQIAKSMQLRRNERLEIVETAVRDIEQTIVDLNLTNVTVYGRPKHIYSIYRKMHDKHKAFDEIYDLLAIRVLVNTVGDCYAVLGAIHSHWTPMPGRFKDYIALPKANGYQSLHTSVIGPGGRPLEVQIRTHEMHEIAEFGVAAHWAYKEGNFKGADVQNTDQQKLNVIQGILELQNESSDSGDFMESVKSDLFVDRVYAFTPKGDVFELSQGAGPLDMAYTIHTNVGNMTTGAKVNDKIVPLDYEIKTGDIVEILTSANAKPNRDWLKLVKTRRARNKIKQYFRKQDRDENIEAGKAELAGYLSAQGFDPETLMLPDNAARAMEKLHYHTVDDMYASIGFGELSAQGVSNKFTEEIRAKIEEQRLAAEQKSIFEDHETVGTTNTQSKNTRQRKGDDPILIQGIDSMLVRLGHCCTPVPGDNVVGYITKGRGVSVHRVGCPNLAAADELGQRLVDVAWEEPQGNSKREYDADLIITGENRSKFLNDIIRMVGNQTKMVSSINGRVDSNNHAVVSMTVGVKNLEQLQRVMDSVKNVKDVDGVKRAFK
ncbi:bifunctional (p)ppGpp synthetase/guanosine-3',5'-bis(diphosphate) 3'-pyrophosphohydrolase [Weissella diestrammenae]|uniref:GTP diphosphokinase n=1 Tax=Weissella diestrammenae TaxID=1162633 RepID=A0A7G9T5R3_9LACO|nr:bifunctional (p)ppGpp synthetase/guanosine-3',5'-bis(diphosphate) 3'-pyrophosphohydrolase [Weissella diestrammenae]MCM0582265.1 bifunctional (p)ppGpp synthetase/guanosine-3',5'-bis(diphosphate) 3'-pyrophosphohydrolase [Weissella diestrammenae]QNN75438.1 bifunctional (p)ppGpp synthetase/guanosine-3',5'-bis(diphosphate) 3'-pyrophosphohydrolase [Weissella diestrammenae]